jgi:hypothetical protein
MMKGLRREFSMAREPVSNLWSNGSMEYFMGFSFLRGAHRIHRKTQENKDLKVKYLYVMGNCFYVRGKCHYVQGKYFYVPGK